MKIITFLLKYSRRTVILAIIAGIISGVTNVALLALINSVLAHYRTSIALILSFAALCLLLPLTRVCSQVLLAHLSRKALYELRMNLCSQILSAPLRKLEELGTPRLLTSLTEDVQVTTNVLIDVPIIFLQLSIVVGSLIYLAWLSWVVALGVIVYLFVGISMWRFAVMKASKYLKFARDDWDALFRHFRALTEGLKELKLHRGRRQAFFTESLQKTAQDYGKHNVIGVGIYSAAGSTAQLLFFILLGLLCFAAPLVPSVQVSTLTGYVLILLYMQMPLDMLMSLLPSLARANIALNRVESLGLTLAAMPVDEGEPHRPDDKAVWERLELKGVTHTYYLERENSSFTLGPLDLTFYSGEITFIVGGNGSGKTTLAKLIAGLYIPQAGEIRIDGQPVTDENRDDYRQYFSVVFTDFYLFETLLGLSAPELDEQARQYLVDLQLDHKVQVVDGVLSTIELSQGQRKRLALLTAYLEDRPIYVFDEWAADQDPYFKEIFYFSILPVLKAKGKTVLVISHDDRYYHVGDRIIKIDYGQLVYDEPVERVPSATVETPVPAKI